MSKTRIILGNAPIANGNRGCVALTYSSMYLIDKIMTDAGQEYELYLTDSQFQKSGMHEIEMNNSRITFHQINHVKSFNATMKVKQLLKFKEHADFKSIFRQSDFILDIGQGDSFADIYGKYRFDTINLIHSEARHYHKPYCLLPQTIGPFKSEGIRKEANGAIAGARMVMARDRQSYDYVIKNVPQQKNLKEYIDVAFFLPYTRQHFDEKFVHVGLNISALLWHGGYTRDNQFGLKVDYQQTVREIINHFLQMPDVQLHLIPHVVLSERNVENDYEVCYDLKRDIDHSRLVLAPLFLSPIDAKSYISGMDFFMGARMHATIAAFSSGVPVVSMAYSRKFNGLFVDTLGYDHMADLLADSSHQVIQLVSSSFSDRHSIKEQINHILETVVEDRKKVLVEDLKKFLQQK